MITVRVKFRVSVDLNLSLGFSSLYSDVTPTVAHKGHAANYKVAAN